MNKDADDNSGPDDTEGRDQSRDLLAGELTPATLRAIGLRADELAGKIRAAYARIDTVDAFLSPYWQSMYRIRLDAALEAANDAADHLTRTAADLARVRARRAGRPGEPS